jgi:hypothetical protein
LNLYKSLPDIIICCKSETEQIHIWRKKEAIKFINIEELNFHDDLFIGVA